jgi:hypothetical protein
MRPNPSRDSPQATPDGVVDDRTMAARGSAEDRDDESVSVTAATQDIYRSEGEPMSPETPRVSRLRRGRAGDPPKWRRLGAVEYALLVLIALGIAITVVMAILNPSA